MDRIAQLLESLATNTPEEMEELSGLLNQEIDALLDGAKDSTPTAEAVAALDNLTNGLQAVKDETTRRDAEATERATRMEEIRAKVDNLRGNGDAPGGDEPAPTEADPADPATPDAPAEDEPAPTDEPAAVEGAESPLVPVAASAAPRGSTGGSMVSRMAANRGPAQPAGGAPAEGDEPIQARVLVASGVPHFNAGDELDGPLALGMALSERLNRMKSSHDFDPSGHLVASMEWTYPEDRTLGNDAQRNTDIVSAVCGLGAPKFNVHTGAIVATGGICLPTNVDYSVPTWSTADRPLRDGLPGFQATRGGVQFVSPPDIGVPSLQGGTPSGAGLATTIWTEATDANPAGQTKPVWTVECGPVQEVYVDAVPTRVQFGNMQSRFAPEQVAANTQQAIAAAARDAELNLLTLIANSSTQVTPQGYLGASRDILASVDLLRSQYLYSHRIPRTASFTAIFPEWGKDVIRADLLRELAHDNTNGRDVMAISDQQIEDWFAVRNVNVIWTLDGLQAGTYGTGSNAITNQYFTTLGSESADPEPQWPGQTADGAFMLVWFLYVEGTYQFLDGGRLDLGVVRDSLLDATNDYETFVETFEGIAFRGLDCYQVQSTIRPTGGSAGTVSTTDYHE